MPTLRVRRCARAEIRDAFDWYRFRSPAAAGEFLGAVDRALSDIADAPERSPVVSGRLRRTLLRGFPYAIYYKRFPSVISVVGVIHGHRHPSTWLERAEP